MTGWSHIRAERSHAISGVPGRLFPCHAWGPDLFSSQTWKSEARPIDGYGVPAVIRAEIRFDDQCRNGRNSFSITGTVSTASGRGPDDGFLSGGCVHEEIAAAFPELAHLIRWHLTDAGTGPMHGVANAIYFAGDRDHNGLRKGETRQIVNGRSKLPAWTLEAVNGPDVLLTTARDGSEGATVPVYRLKSSIDCDASELPDVPALRWVPMVRVGEGKARDLDAARRAAVWPGATDEELCAEPAALRAALEARLPALLAAFESDIRATGLAWTPAEIKDAEQ